MFKVTKKKMAAVAVASAALIGGTAAYAFWTSTGSGTGTATVGTSADWNVTTAPDALNESLAPDGPTDSYTITVQNDAAGTQQLHQLDVSVANSDGTPWAPLDANDDPIECSADDFQVGTAAAGGTFSITGLTDDILPGAANANSSHTFTLQMVDTGLNQDGCKNISVPLYVHAS